MAKDPILHTYSPDDPSQVRELFSRISARYDFLNSAISLGAHKRWKRLAAREAALRPGQAALDLCCGTGDMAFALAESWPGCVVVGIDFALPMLKRFKARSAERRGASQAEMFAVCADVHALPVRPGSFDAAVIAFGLRNIPDRRGALVEVRNSVRVGGRLVVLDVAKPPNRLLRTLVGLYLRLVVPLLGWAFTRNWGFYAYLHASLDKYLSREDLAGLMRDTGFGRVGWQDLALGAATLHVGVKE
jgi:demethylmenaquinone methyltransferase/2-methoxy-6-polyprenyl-1,4-benzoquinol methylase